MYIILEVIYVLDDSQHNIVNLFSVMYGMNNIKFYLPINLYVYIELLRFSGTDVHHSIVGPYENICHYLRMRGIIS
jgi:hypothetical protein